MSTVTQTFDIPGTKEIVLQGWGEIDLSQGEQELLTIETSDEIMQRLKHEVNNGRFELGFKSFMDHFFSITHPKIHYTIIVKDLRRFSISGAGSVQAGAFNTDEMKLSLSGAGKMSFAGMQAGKLEIGISGSGNINVDDLQADKLEFHLPGSGKGTIKGTVGQVEVGISGSGSLDASQLTAENGSGRISGMGHAEVNVASRWMRRSAGWVRSATPDARPSKAA